jgi:hypothetical protein
MGHLKQLEYGGKKLGRKILNDGNLFSSDPGVVKESSATTLRRRTCARERARHWRRRRRPPDNARRSKATAPTDVYAPVHILCWKIHVGAHSAHVGGLFLPRREPYSAVLEKTTQENSKL